MVSSCEGYLSYFLIYKTEQCDILEKDACVIIRNAEVHMFKGFIRVRVDKWGRVVPFEGNENVAPGQSADFEPTTDESKNRSLLEYELVEERKE